MKPNFIIAMYCLILLLIKPRLHESLIIGILAGAISQFFPGTPYINLVSEPIGAVVMSLLISLLGKIRIPLKPAINTFIATLASGFAFIGLMYLLFYAGMDVVPTPLGVFMGIIFGTACVNAIIVQVLYAPLRLALKKEA